MDRARRALDTADASGLAQERRFGVERFHFPVALVLVLLLMESLVGTRRRVVETEAQS
jgi:hypothetical protein